MKVDSKGHNHTAFGRVRDIAAPVTAPKAKPAPPENTAGPLAPETKLPASITDTLPANITGLLYPGSAK